MASGEYDFPLAETQVIWDACDHPELPAVELVRVGSGYEDDDRYISSWGACSSDFAESSATDKVNMLMRQFVHLAAFEGVAPTAIHKAFMQIPEYRRAMADHGSLDPDAI